MEKSKKSHREFLPKSKPKAQPSFMPQKSTAQKRIPSIDVDNE